MVRSNAGEGYAKCFVGKGCVFTYDAVGSYELVGYNTRGSGATLITPLLDNQLKSPSPLLLPAVDAITPLLEYIHVLPLGS
ncbi:Proteasome subunit beta type-1 [Orobanche hederae]